MVKVFFPNYTVQGVDAVSQKNPTTTKCCEIGYEDAKLNIFVLLLFFIFKNENETGKLNINY